MAESSLGWTTSGVGDGSSSGYTMAQFTEWQRMLFAGLTGTDLSGAAPDYLNKLAVSGTSSPIAVNTGGALVYGFPYVNTASLNVVVPTPSTLTRIDRIVLEVNWAAQTVRVARVAGSEGGSAPSLTQTAGTTWQMPLAQASITTGGVITLTDQREWLSVVGEGAVTTSKLASLSVTAAKLATDVKIGPTVMYIPLLLSATNAGGGSPGVTFATSSYIQAYPEIEVTKEHFSTAHTVKLVVMFSGGTTSLKSFDLYNVTTAATVTGSEVTSASSTSLQQLKSGDIRTNLAAGSNRYTIRGKIAAGSVTSYAAYLLVEW